MLQFHVHIDLSGREIQHYHHYWLPVRFCHGRYDKLYQDVATKIDLILSKNVYHYCINILRDGNLYQVKTKVHNTLKLH